MKQQNKYIKWRDPLKIAHIISNHYNKNWIFLYSGLKNLHKNSYSFLALFPRQEFKFEKYQDFKETKLDNKYLFGYFSYEINKEIDEISSTKDSYIDLPKIWLTDFEIILKFDHKDKKISVFFDENIYLKKLLELISNKQKIVNNTDISIKNLNSNFTDYQYLDSIKHIKNHIINGDIYQANLTRKFFGKFSPNNNNNSNNNYFELFLKLNKISPGNYSSFLKLGNNHILSSSPELFLTTKNKHIYSRPIKGTIARAKDKKMDLANKVSLRNNPKEVAENLMIVDLVRNDLSRVARTGSVKVKKLFKINSYKTIHHMSSEVQAKLKNNISFCDIFEATFPPGSMTGAPKIKAMNIIANQEKIDRSVYSGAIGYFMNNQNKVDLNLSVVIRTLIINNDNFEFQAGGAITYDSIPEMELKESKDKLKAICKLLNLKTI